MSTENENSLSGQEIIGSDLNDFLVGAAEADDTISGLLGRDTIYGDGIVGSAALFASDADVLGGNDTILTPDFFLNPYTDEPDVVSGDARIYADNAVLTGGDDVIQAAAEVNGDGDITATYTATLLGGNDTIAASEYIDGDGDISLQSHLATSATFVGGHDHITVVQNVEASWGQLIEGDGVLLSKGENFTFSYTGGNDVIEGNFNANQIWGDGGASFGGTNVSGSFVAGHDQIKAGDGDDAIVGDGSISASNAGFTNISVTWGNDLLDGEAGNDFIMGDYSWEDIGDPFYQPTHRYVIGGGDDTLIGGTGDDTLIGAGGDDVYIFNLGDGSDLIIDGGYEQATGAGTDTIRFGDGILQSDVVFGADGDDLIITFNNSPGDQIRVQGHFNILTPGNRVERFEFADNSVLTHQDVLDAFGDDSSVINGTSGSDFIYATSTYQTVLGGDGHDYIQLSSEGDVADGGKGNDTIDAGSGNDTLIGGLGHDTFIVNASNVTVVEGMNQGYDTVLTTLDHTLSDNVEDLRLMGTGNINGTGNAEDNTIYGNSGNNVLNGKGGYDMLDGGAGDDTYLFEDNWYYDQVMDASGNDTVDFSNVTSNLTIDLNSQASDETGDNAAYFYDGIIENALGGSGNDQLFGTEKNNMLSGNAGSDFFNAGLGNDTLNGGEGADTYQYQRGDGNDLIHADAYDTLLLNGISQDELTFTNDDGQIVITIAGTQQIRLQASQLSELGSFKIVFDDESSLLLNEVISFANTVSGTSENDNLVGSTGNDSIQGFAGDDTLTGNAGTDTLAGGLGNDTYILDDNDMVVENPDEGIDTVRSSISYTLTDNVENLVLTGTGSIQGVGNALNNLLTGNGAANTLLGLEGDDTLDGAGGADTMSGGVGNDFYKVDHQGDVVIEGVGEGTDTVQARVSYTLGTNVERLILDGSNLTGTGNALDNTLISQGSKNTLAGGLGNDYYVLNSSTDKVVEGQNAGIDTVEASFSYDLGSNVENLVLTGNSAVAGTGNSLNNTITGNDAVNLLLGEGGHDALYGNGGSDILYGGSGNDTLDGGSGIDLLIGGNGNDTYVVDNALDIVLELLTDGNDTVQSSISYSLGSGLENLTLTGSANLNGSGNSANNVMIGNSGANLLKGENGNDTLQGGAGNDTLQGGKGNDVYKFGLGDGVDTVIDTAGSDKLLFDSSVSQSSIAIFKTASDDLQIGYTNSSGDLITIDDFGKSAGKVEKFELSNGKYMTDAEINQIVSQMSSYAAANGVSFTNLDDVKNDAGLLAIVNGGWHS